MTNAQPRKTLPSSGESDASRASRPRRILVVDDVDDVRTTLCDLLETFGYHVSSARNGLEALELLEQRRFDTAVIDIGLPDLDGYELARRVRDAGRRVQLLAVTGYGQRADREQALDAGFDRHMTKPVNVRELRCAIDSDSYDPE